MSVLSTLVLAFALVAGAEQQVSEQPVEISLQSPEIEVTPGSLFRSDLTFKIDEGFHIGAAGGEEVSWLPTDISIDPESEALFSITRVEWPDSHEWSMFGLSMQVYEGTVVVSVVVHAPEELEPGIYQVPLQVQMQICSDSQCMYPEPPVLVLSVNVVEGPPISVDAPVSQEGGGANDGSSGVYETNIFGHNIRFNTNGWLGLLLVFLLAYVGGIILNLWPCVWPFVPIKVQILRSHANSRWKLFVHLLMMCLGIVSVWAILGLTIATVSSVNATSAIFQSPMFGIGVGVFIIVMALAMMDLQFANRFFNTVPALTSRFNPTGDTPQGAFVFGVMTAVVATPCTGPFMGAAAAWAVRQQQPVLTTMLFAMIGFGLATPYFILVAFPKMISWLPKTGPWSLTIKKVAGFLTLATGCFFAGAGIRAAMPEFPQLGLLLQYWVAQAFVACGVMYVIYQVWTESKSTMTRIIVTLVSLSLLFGSLYATKRLSDIEFAQFGTHAAEGAHEGLWVPYEKDIFDQAIARDQVVLLKFTAPTCFTCKILDLTVIHTEELTEYLKAKDVTTLVVDISKPEGDALLKAHGETGVPLLVVYGPGQKDGGPVKTDSYTIADVMRYVTRAGGE
jgi:thiol:disulfide interchange protein